MTILFKQTSLKDTRENKLFSRSGSNRRSCWSSSDFRDERSTGDSNDFCGAGNRIIRNTNHSGNNRGINNSGTPRTYATAVVSNPSINPVLETTEGCTQKYE